MPPEQTAATASPSLPPSPPIMQRFNPSPELQQKVAAAIQACTKWQPELVETAKGLPLPPQASTEAQVCDVLDRWPVAHNGEALTAASIGVVFAFAAVGLCLGAWAVARWALGVMPFAPAMAQLVTRVIQGGLCGVALVTVSLLLSLPTFVAATFEQMADNAVLFWSSAAPWASAVFAMVFVLPAIPYRWAGQRVIAAGSGLVSPGYRRED